MDYIHGEPFNDTLIELGKKKAYIDILTKNQTRFYMGCVVASINYLHERKIIYRDLKPDNLITNENVQKF